MNFYEVEKITNEAIQAARLAAVDDAVNWADLRCVDVEKCENMAGEVHFTVTIEEASPMADDFAKFIWEYIMKHTGISVRVVTEW